MKKTLIRTAMVALGAASMGLAACDQDVRGGEAVQTEIYVLIDLSETWYNPSTEARNRRLLSAVGRGAGLASEASDPPYLVQYRVIGDLAYMREPICTVVYTPGFRRRDDEEEFVHRPRDVSRYLTNACLDGVFTHPPEQATEISSALASIAEEPRPSPETRRSLIVLSDFLEEASEGASFEPDAFAGARVLLMYRPLEEDSRSQTGARLRVQYWREQLLAAGAATVEVAPDTSVRPSQIVSFLTDD